ncbi:hypothetical protein J6590_010801 [Homalodisca vitripennis]|nr:hypothetical protein J6590_010801 [Homalodisca vitripennis]
METNKNLKMSLSENNKQCLILGANNQESVTKREVMTAWYSELATRSLLSKLFKQGGLNTPPLSRCDATLSQYPYHCSEFASLLYTLTGPLPQANLIPKRKLPGYVYGYLNLLN